MKPKIQNTEFGSITINHERYFHDVIIRSDGEVVKRKKKLSKKKYGTSHTISLEEIRFIYTDDVEQIIIGTGQYDKVRLSPEAKKYLRGKDCDFLLMSTPMAIKNWNKIKGKCIGLFHVTC